MIKKIRNCFDKAPVNLGRQRELDVLKGIFIFFMSFSHCIEILGWFFDPGDSLAALWRSIDMVLKSTVIVAISCIGINLCYSSRGSARALFRRAIGMLGMVAMLELSRTVIPCFIEWVIFRDFESIRYAYQVLSVDIFQFVTLAFAVLALFKKLRLKPIAMLLIAFVCSVIGQLMHGVSTGSFFGNLAVGFIWHSHGAAYFPILSWLIALIIGYSFGYAYLRLRDKDTFFKIVTPISLVISVLYFLSMILVGEWYYFSNGYFYGISFLDVLFMFTFFLSLAGISYFLSKLMPRGTHWFESAGIRMTSIYCIHWVIYAFLYLILTCVVGDNYVPAWAVAPVAILVPIVADLLSRLYKKFRANGGKKIL